VYASVLLSNSVKYYDDSGKELVITQKIRISFKEKRMRELRDKPRRFQEQVHARENRDDHPRISTR
jgi:hypothetical protein